jgi:hypothetical protein
MNEAAPHAIPNAVKQRIPDRSIMRKYSQSPAIPRVPMRSKKTISFPEKMAISAIAHIAIALINRR